MNESVVMEERKRRHGRPAGTLLDLYPYPAIDVLYIFHEYAIP